MQHRPLAFFLCTFLLSGFSTSEALPGQSTPSEKKPQAIQEMCERLGMRNLPRNGLRILGELKFTGLTGKLEWLIYPDGRFVQTDRSRFTAKVGYDGKNAWRQDWTGLRRSLSFEDREVALVSFWLMTGLWTLPNVPLEIDARSADSGQVYSVKLKDGKHSFTVSLSPETGLPASFRQENHDESRVWTLQNYVKKASTFWPSDIRSEKQGSENVYALKTVEPAPSFFRDPCMFVAFIPEDSEFLKDRTEVLAIKPNLADLILIPAKVDGRNLGWFIFDSGSGGMILSKEAAEKINAETFGSMVAKGATGYVVTEMCQTQEIEVGPMKLNTPIFTILDLEFLDKILGLPIGGICGYDVFARSVVEVDYEERFLAIRNPAKFSTSTDLPWQSLHLFNNVPAVQADFAPNHKGVFRLDTGDPGTLTFHTPTVERLSLLHDRKTTGASLGGVGGGAPARAGELEWFELGGKRFEDIRVLFSQAKQGAMASEALDGNIGRGILSHFKIYFDYGKERIALTPKN